jgi:hypothetical protein
MGVSTSDLIRGVVLVRAAGVVISLSPKKQIYLSAKKEEGDFLAAQLISQRSVFALLRRISFASRVSVFAVSLSIRNVKTVSMNEIPP